MFLAPCFAQYNVFCGGQDGEARSIVGEQDVQNYWHAGNEFSEESIHDFSFLFRFSGVGKKRPGGIDAQYNSHQSLLEQTDQNRMKH